MGERSNPNSAAYIARCKKELERCGAPLDGWKCINVFDIRDAKSDGIMFQCELCGCPSVRFVHVMAHPEYSGFINVGCICAGLLEGNILNAKKRERLMKNRASRRENFINRQGKLLFRLPYIDTKYDFPVGYQYTYKRHKICLYPIDWKNPNGNWQYVIDTGIPRTKSDYKDMSFKTALYSAFDEVDPIKNILK